MMNQQDMDNHGLTSDGKVHVSSDHGMMENVAVVPFDIPPGNVMAYYPEANILTGNAVDPRSQTPAFKSTTVTIERVN